MPKSGYGGVVFSTKNKQVYCLENSHYHQKIKEQSDLDIIHLPYSKIQSLILNNPKVDEWTLDDVLTE